MESNTEFDVPTVDNAPEGIATGADGALWFTETTTNKIGRLVPPLPLTANHDFNFNGKSDMLWRDNTGNVALWLMNGGQVASNVLVSNVPTSWSIVGQRDFNGDGKSRHPLARHRRQCRDLADERRTGRLERNCLAMSRPPGRSSAPAISTATARPTFSGATPPAMWRSG